MEKIVGSSRGTEEALSGFGFAALKMNEGLMLAKEGFEALAKVWESTVGKFREAQDNVTRLSGSLALFGEKDVKGATDSMVKFSEAMQDNTTLSKDQAINLLALGKAAGQSNEMSEKLVQTATDLAAATGEDVNSAFQGLVSTLKGHARGVGEASIFIRNLTEDELKAGKGVDVLAARMKGFAQVQAQTFGGAAKQTANKMNEIFVQIGGIISRGLNLDNTGKKMLEFVDGILKKINELKPALESALHSVRAVFDGITGAISNIDFKGVAEQAKYFAAVVAVALLPVLIPIAGSVAGIAAGFIAAAAPILATVAAVTALGLAFDIIARNIEIIPKIFMDEWRLAISTVKEMLLEMLRSVLETATKMVGAIASFIPGLGDIGAKAQDSLKGFTDSVDKSLDEVGMSGAGLFDKLAEDSKKVDFGLAGKLKDQLGNIVTNFKKSFEAAKATPIGGGGAGPKLPTGQQAAPEEFRSKFKLFSEDDIKEIKNAFGPGVGQFGVDVNGMTAGLMQFAGSADIMLSAAQKMVDLIPGLIDKATHLIESITDFPNKLATSVANFATAIEKFVANFVPNVIKGVEKILDVLSTAFEKLPDIFGAMVEKLPQLLTHLIDKIPTFVSRFIIGFITQMPKIAIALTVGMVKGMPQVAKELIKVIVTELPPAIVKAIVEAVKEIADALLHGFKGITLDPSQLTNGIKAMAKTLTNESSKLFQVVDASAAARGENQAQAIADAIDSALNRAVALLRALWAALKAIWQWVYDHIIGPFITMLKEAWQWIYDHIIGPIVNDLKAVWNYLVTAFQGIINFFNSLGGLVGQAFQAVFDFFGKILKGNISGAFQGVYDFFSSFPKTFANAVTDALNGINPANLFKKIFDTSGAFGDRGTVEKTLGIDVPFMSFAQGGVVPGKAPYDGDHRMNDRLLGWFSAGEAIVPISKMKNPAVAKLINGIIDGSIQVPAFKGGLKGVSTHGAVASVSGGVNTVAGVASGVASGISSFAQNPAGFITSEYQKALQAAQMLDPQKLWAEVLSYVGQGIMAMFEHNKFDKGGMIRGYAFGGAVPMIGHDGEFVLNRRAVNNIGVANLQQMNSQGGASQQPAGPTNIDLKINIEHHGVLDDNTIRSKIAPEIMKQMKKASTEGRFILSNRGLRDV